MANTKKITVDYSQTAKTIYVVIRREVDGYLLNDSGGSFASAPADPYVSLTEDTTIKGRYEVSESRSAWDDGKYILCAYLQAGGSPAPVSDMIVSSGEMYIADDTEISFATLEPVIERIVGLSQENQYIDNTTFNSSNNLLTARKRIYSSSANVGTDTGVIATYNVTATFSGGNMLTYKETKV